MRDNLLSNNLFLHGTYKATFESMFLIDLSFMSDYDNAYKQAMRSRRHSIWKELRRAGEQVHTDSSKIQLTPTQQAETMIRKIRHSHSNYDKLWKSMWLHDKDSGLIHGDYRIAACTRIVDIFPELVVGYDLVIDQCVYEQERLYESLSNLLEVQRMEYVEKPNPYFF